MAPELTFKYKCDLDEAILRYKHHYGLNMEKVLKEQMRLLIMRVLQFTPPAKKGDGVKAVRRDIKHKYYDPDWFANNFIGRKSPEEQERIRRYFKTQDWTSLEKIKDAGGLLQKVYFKPFSKSDIHRDTRGRIIKTREGVICTTPEALKEYVKTEESHVGRLKGSWCSALEYYGGKAAAWVKRNSEGSYVDNSKGTDVQSVAAYSSVPYGEGVDRRVSFIDKAMKTRARDIEASIEKNVLNKAQRAYYGV
jgi:hypothetical protein